ncbi:hypothetical protein [Bradyrhizobium sp. RT3a]|uniref:hypothetical protein n=1 Tax=Bradyrhizobium sp. RT3a TaxID=3156333 RepID=UPI0033922E2F
MKRLISTGIALIVLISIAHAEEWSEEIENARNHGYNSAAFERICPGMTVSDPALRAKLDAKYRTNPKMKKYFKEYYGLNAERENHKDKLTGVMTMCFTASNAKWIKWDEAARNKLVVDEKLYSAEKARRKERFDLFDGKSR